jgi:beta-phosphoglucomutase-like phosphatase (HAD superfamily)
MQLDIPQGDFAGFIFDLDGTLVDTMPLHYLAWDEAMHAVGLKEKLSEDLFYSAWRRADASRGRTDRETLWAHTRSRRCDA